MLKEKKLQLEKSIPEQTIINFAIVFRGPLEVFGKIKTYILQQGCNIVYQTKSTEKIWIQKELKGDRELARN
jgi:hypothetical protein